MAEVAMVGCRLRRALAQVDEHVDVLVVLQTCARRTHSPKRSDLLRAVFCDKAVGRKEEGRIYPHDAHGKKAKEVIYVWVVVTAVEKRCNR
jgi:hypothetical protein